MKMFVDINEIYLYRDPVDFRKAINGLSLIKEKFKWPRKNQDPVMHLTEDQWHWLLSGYDINKLKGHQPLQFSSCVD
ncbi:Mobile element protein [hydrothermal vent metagenome]|uniref:Mobile element protein n=1 Tax=hydrothermal vent metagenome TaxID=652676 RepID=A0A3B0YSL0_9ZZZZ